MYKLLVFALLFSTSVISSNSLEDNDKLRQQLITQLQNMKDFVKKEPKEATKQLDLMFEKIDPINRKLNLLYLLRQAEAANFSYLFDDFEKHINQGFSLLDENDAIEIRGMFLIYQGLLQQRAGDYEQALATFNFASQLADQKAHQYIYIYALVERAYTLSLSEEFETALREIQKSYVLASKIDNSFLLGVIEETYGAIYLYLNKLEDSLAHFKKALNIYQKLDYPYYISESTLGIATTYRYWQHWDEAITWLNLYRTASQNISSDYSEFYYSYGLAMIYADKGDCEQALTYMSDALKIQGFIDYKAEIYKSAAFCYAKSGDFAEAKNSIEKARDIFAELPELVGTSWALEVDKIEAQIMAFKGEYQTAYQLLESYYSQYNEVHKKNTSIQFEKLQIEMKVEREKLEIAMLENKSQVQSLKLKEQSRKNEIQQLWIYGALVLFCIIFIVFLWQLKVAKRLKSLSLTDELTGLSNRRFMFDTIEKLLSNKVSKNVYHTLMQIDVDGLKPINDFYGHQDGDKVIKMVANAGSAVLRYGDVFARIGGDEYMLLLTRSEPQQEIAIAKRVINEINQTPIVTRSGEVIHASVSIGIVSIQDHLQTIETIYTKVDQALYRAKKNGRNCISH